MDNLVSNIYRALLVSIVLVVTGCGGNGGGPQDEPSDGSGSSPPPEVLPPPDAGNATGFIAISITDAPVENVSEVVVEFTGVTLQSAGGNRTEYHFDNAKRIDLLKFNNGLTAELLDQQELPVGEYEWARLHVNAQFDNIYDSFAMTPTGQVELRVPGSQNTGLKLVSGFTITQGQLTHLVVDWDIRKALTDPKGQPGYHLRPALRVTDMSSYGTLQGSVADALVMDESCTNDLAMDTGNAVYVYDAVVTGFDDIGGQDADPLTTGTVRQNQDGAYVYRIDFLPVGDYSVAFTCQASDDDPESDDDIEFTAPKAAVIQNGVTTTVNFN